jgi:excisionase family DNA binding protein
VSNLAAVFSREVAQIIERVIDAKIATALTEREREQRAGDLLTVAEVAEALSISETAARSRIDRGRIPVVRQGRSVYVRRGDLWESAR